MDKFYGTKIAPKTFIRKEDGGYYYFRYRADDNKCSTLRLDFVEQDRQFSEVLTEAGYKEVYPSLNRTECDSKVISMNVRDAIKDEALNYCIASGEEDVFLDMDTVDGRVPEGVQLSEGLKTVISLAKEAGAGFLHLY